MKSIWAELRPLLLHIAAFSFVINLLFLVPAMFTLQVFDRVIASNSQETLVVLLVGTGVALLILFLVDYVRNRLQNVLGSIIDERLSPPVVKAVVVRTARSPQSIRSEGIRDVATLRSVFASSSLSAMMARNVLPNCLRRCPKAACIRRQKNRSSFNSTRGVCRISM